MKQKRKQIMGEGKKGVPVGFGALGLLESSRGLLLAPHQDHCNNRHSNHEDHCNRKSNREGNHLIGGEGGVVLRCRVREGEGERREEERGGKRWTMIVERGRIQRERRRKRRRGRTVPR